jgi:glycosyltransferase involved in cell wall biosynthesis
MRLLFIFPFCSKEINSISYGSIFLGNNGHNVLILTSQNAISLKGKVQAPENEILNGTEFFRPYLWSDDMRTKTNYRKREVLEKIHMLDPELIYCFGITNYNLGKSLKKELNIPLIYFLEYIKEQPPFPRIKGQTLLRKLFPYAYNLIAKDFLKKLLLLSDAIMYSYYGEIENAKAIELKEKKPIRYVPWCNEVDVKFKNTDIIKDNTAIYIGSIEPFKNSEDLIKSIPIILDNVDIEKFVIVGPGSLAENIIDLKEKYGDRIEYYKSMPRLDALQLIAKAKFSFTPVKDCGLGFIGDSWAVKTPLVTLYNLDGFIKDGIDALVINDINKLPKYINNLLSNKEIYRNMQSNGYKRYVNYFSAKAIAEKYLEIGRIVLNKHE